jgi:hypothetical protein
MEGLGATGKARLPKDCIYIDKCFLCDNAFPWRNRAIGLLNADIELFVNAKPIDVEAFGKTTQNFLLNFVWRYISRVWLVAAGVVNQPARCKGCFICEAPIRIHSLVRCGKKVVHGA